MILLETYTDFYKEHKWALESISPTKTFCTRGHLGVYTQTLNMEESPEIPQN